MKKSILLLPVLLITLAGCTASNQQTPPPQEQAPTFQTRETQISNNISRIEYYFEKNESAKIITYTLKNPKVELAHNSIEPKSVSSWHQESPDATLIANAAYFNEDFTPTGGLRINNKNISKTTFDYERSGLIITNPKLEIIDTASSPQTIEQIAEGFQSYPFLITNNNPSISEDSELTARRTFIATDTQDNTIIGIVPEKTLTLFELSQELQKMNPNIKTAINLDGGPSSGISVQTEKFQELHNSFTGVPSVLIVE